MTIYDVELAHAQAGGHFFEAGVYFVTSERFHPSSGPASPRRYTVRQWRPDQPDDVHTVGEFNRLSRRTARRLAYECSIHGVQRGLVRCGFGDWVEE